MPLRSLALGIVVVIAGCSLFAGHGGATTLDGVTLIRHDPSDASPSALLNGRIEVVDGCVALVGKDWRAFVLWPDGFDLRKGDGGLEVVGDGFVIPIGATVEAGGGFMHLGNAQTLGGRRDTRAVPGQGRVVRVRGRGALGRCDVRRGGGDRPELGAVG